MFAISHCPVLLPYRGYCWSTRDIHRCGHCEKLLSHGSHLADEAPYPWCPTMHFASLEAWFAVWISILSNESCLQKRGKHWRKNVFALRVPWSLNTFLRTSPRSCCKGYVIEATVSALLLRLSNCSARSSCWLAVLYWWENPLFIWLRKSP